MHVKTITPIVTLVLAGILFANTPSPSPCSFGAVTASASLFAQDELDTSALDDLESSEPAENQAEPESVAEPSEENTNAQTTAGRTRASELILSSGWIGVLLLLGSILAVSLIIRLCFALRRNTFLPERLEAALSEAIAKGAYGSAAQIAANDDSFIGRVSAAGLKEADRGWLAMEKALEDAASDQTAAMYRRTDPLSTIGNVAPMLGLLGTVVGMVLTFGELAVAEAGGRNLANGIYFALVTTVEGLVVAIPVLIAHSLLNARIASLVSEASTRIDRIFAPAKRQLQAQSAPAPTRAPQRPQYSARPQETRPATDSPVPGLREVTPPNNSQEEQTPPPTPPRHSLSLKNRQ